MFWIAKIALFLLDPLNLVLWALMGSIFFLKRSLVWAKRLLLISVMWLFFLGYTPLSAYVLALLENTAVDSHRPIEYQKVKGILVLGGSFESGKMAVIRGEIPLGSAAERVTKAVELQRKHPHLTIVFTGFSGAMVPEGLSEAQMASQFLIEQGVDQEKIWLEGASRNTHENAIYTKKLLQDHGVIQDAWVLITSASHMRRAKAVFDHEGINTQIMPVDFEGDPSPSWGSIESFSIEAGYRKWRMALREILGLIWYRLAGYI